MPLLSEVPQTQRQQVSAAMRPIATWFALTRGTPRPAAASLKSFTTGHRPGRAATLSPTVVRQAISPSPSPSAQRRKAQYRVRPVVRNAGGLVHQFQPPKPSANAFTPRRHSAIQCHGARVDDRNPTVSVRFLRTITKSIRRRIFACKPVFAYSHLISQFSACCKPSIVPTLTT
jgi:hypothetical protein